MGRFEVRVYGESQGVGHEVGGRERGWAVGTVGMRGGTEDGEWELGVQVCVEGRSEQQVGGVEDSIEGQRAHG